ncbi:hypothetical protein AAC387_Pa01g0765 [Persea americana]
MVAQREILWETCRGRVEELNVVDGKKQYLFDENGRRFLDAFGGIATVCCKHCHPEVVEAIVNQTKRLQHSTIVYLNHNVAEFAEALASKLPGDLKVVFFTNSGTEANELAMMIARLYTGCHDIVSLRNGYHGNAAGTMGMTDQSNWNSIWYGYACHFTVGSTSELHCGI